MGDRSWAAITFYEIGSQESLEKVIEFLTSEGFGFEFDEWDETSITLGEEYVCEEGTVGLFDTAQIIRNEKGKYVRTGRMLPADVSFQGSQDAKYEYDGTFIAQASGRQYMTESASSAGSALIDVNRLTRVIQEHRNDHGALLKALDKMIGREMWAALGEAQNRMEALPEDARILTLPED